MIVEWQELNGKVISSSDYDDYSDEVFEVPIDIPIIRTG